jgi:hypothetical protein
MSKIIKATYPFEKRKFLLLSDIHWDNPKCRRDLLKKHLDEAVKEDAVIMMTEIRFA